MTPAAVRLIGCGNMGGALRERWRGAGIAVAVTDPQFAGDNDPVAGDADIVVLAVKPQQWREATAALSMPRLVVSVMAGVALAALEARFPAATVVRAMPNTPARIGAGVTALFTRAPDAAARAEADALMRPAGDCVWLDDETQFDAVTAVSGSGPAYVFAFIEALAAAGIDAGLPATLSARLARQTVIGAAALAASIDSPPAALRAAVTSPGGTTAAGLAALQPGLDALLRATVAAAQSRSSALGRME